MRAEFGNLPIPPSATSLGTLLWSKMANSSLPKSKGRYLSKCVPAGCPLTSTWQSPATASKCNTMRRSPQSAGTRNIRQPAISTLSHAVG